jgi:hypothetical protein
MQRSCEECRQIVLEGDTNEWHCSDCKGMFHGSCVRNKQRAKVWICSGCTGQLPEKGLLLAEAVNKLIGDKEDESNDFWEEMEKLPQQLGSDSFSDSEDEVSFELSA